MDLHELRKFTAPECPEKFFDLCLLCCAYEPSEVKFFKYKIEYK
jgi:hypothetical protein